jgi:hypothetical protein
MHSNTAPATRRALRRAASLVSVIALAILPLLLAACNNNGGSGY